MVLNNRLEPPGHRLNLESQAQPPPPLDIGVISMWAAALVTAPHALTPTLALNFTKIAKWDGFTIFGMLHLLGGGVPTPPPDWLGEYHNVYTFKAWN